MNSSAKPGRVIRTAAPEVEDVFVLGQSTRRSLPGEGVLATASAVIEAGEREAARIIEETQRKAAAIVAAAEASAGSVRGAAYDDGYRAGLQQADTEVRDYVDLVRRAASEGKSVRDELAGQAANVVARAVSLAVRRVVGEYYETEPSRTAAIVAEALRAAAGQEILSIRVNGGLVEAVSVALSDVATYVRPDDRIEAGGCVIDLRNGTIDATLDARLSLLDRALREAGGDASR